MHRDERPRARRVSRGAPSPTSPCCSRRSRRRESSAPGPGAHSEVTRTRPDTARARGTARPTTPVAGQQAPRIAALGAAETALRSVRRRGSREIGGRSISCSTASSHGTHFAPSTSSSSTGPIHCPLATAGRASAVCTCRHRTRTCSAARRPGSTTHSVRHRRALRRRRARLGRRHQHAELPAHLVLPRRRPVRIQHVALVEHGVGDRAGARRTGPRASRLLAGFLQELLDRVVPASASARAALNRVSASSVSRLSISHPLFGK